MKQMVPRNIIEEADLALHKYLLGSQKQPPFLEQVRGDA